MITHQDIVDKFTYHSPFQEGAQTHADLSEAFIQVAELVAGVCPDGRELALAMTNLEQAKMWASAAVARDPGTR